MKTIAPVSVPILVLVLIACSENVDSKEISVGGTFQPAPAEIEPEVTLVYPNPTLLELPMTMPRLSPAENRRIAEHGIGGKLRIGIHRDIPNHMSGNLANRLRWRSYSEG